MRVQICSSGQNAGIRCVSEFLNGIFVNEFSSSGFWEGVPCLHRAPPSKLKLMKQFSSCLQFAIDYNVLKLMEKSFLLVCHMSCMKSLLLMPICFRKFSFYCIHHCRIKINVTYICGCALGLIYNFPFVCHTKQFQK